MYVLPHILLCTPNIQYISLPQSQPLNPNTPQIHRGVHHVTDPTSTLEQTEMLQRIIEKVIQHMAAFDEARDRAYPKARKARTLSKQSILVLHRGEPGEAQRLLSEAARLLTEAQEAAEGFPGVQSSETLSVARQEHAEAAILLSLITEERYPDPQELGLDETNYVLGLADVPGELRRQALDRLREGDLEAAEILLETMEEIYLCLTEAEEASMMLRGMRRKLDVARGVSERTRAEVTAEAGRRRLSRELKSITDKLET
jgi:translin